MSKFPPLPEQRQLALQELRDAVSQCSDALAAYMADSDEAGLRWLSSRNSRVTSKIRQLRRVDSLIANRSIVVPVGAMRPAYRRLLELCDKMGEKATAHNFALVGMPIADPLAHAAMHDDYDLDALCNTLEGLYEKQQ